MGFLSPSGNCWDRVSVKSQQLPSKSFPIVYSPVIVTFGCVAGDADDFARETQNRGTRVLAEIENHSSLIIANLCNI